MEYFAWIEQTTLSSWTRESLLAFPLALVLHAIAMGFLAGTNIAIILRLLGIASGIPLALMGRWMLILYISFWLAVFSGCWLLLAYPAKALTNPVFYLKLSLILLGMGLMLWFKRRLFSVNGLGSASDSMRIKALAILSLLFWIGAITAGRLLAYTHNIEMVS